MRAKRKREKPAIIKNRLDDLTKALTVSAVVRWWRCRQARGSRRAAAANPPHNGTGRPSPQCPETKVIGIRKTWASYQLFSPSINFLFYVTWHPEKRDSMTFLWNVICVKALLLPDLVRRTFFLSKNFN